MNEAELLAEILEKLNAIYIQLLIVVGCLGLIIGWGFNRK